MLDLDYKVFGRDSIILEGVGLDGFFKNIYDKTKAFVKKISQAVGHIVLPDRLYDKLSDWGSKHRMNLKMLGAVVVTAVASTFIGPAAGQLVTSLGGPTIASMAAEKVVVDYVKDAVKKKLTRDMIDALKRKFKNMTAEQVLADPELSELSQKIAAEMGEAVGFKETFVRNGSVCWYEEETRYSEYAAPPTKLIGPKKHLDAIDEDRTRFIAKTMKCQPMSDDLKESAAILAAEGAIEMQHQISKIAAPSNQPRVLKKPIKPINPMIWIGLAAAAVGIIFIARKL